MKRRAVRFLIDLLVCAVLIYGVLVLMAVLDARARRIHAQELAKLYAVARAECSQEQRDNAWRDLDAQAVRLMAPIGAASSPQELAE